MGKEMFEDSSNCVTDSSRSEKQPTAILSEWTVSLNIITSSISVHNAELYHDGTLKISTAKCNCFFANPLEQDIGMYEELMGTYAQCIFILHSAPVCEIF